MVFLPWQMFMRQRFPAQSALTRQPCPASHWPQVPPQSMPVSLPLVTPSMQVGAWHFSSVQTPLEH